MLRAPFIYIQLVQTATNASCLVMLSSLLGQVITAFDFATESPNLNLGIKLHRKVRSLPLSDL